MAQARQSQNALARLKPPASGSPAKVRPEDDFERELAAVTRRYNTRARGLLELSDARDEIIRRALSAGARRGRIAEITGLSPQRIDQIRRGARL